MEHHLLTLALVSPKYYTCLTGRSGCGVGGGGGGYSQCPSCLTGRWQQRRDDYLFYPFVLGRSFYFILKENAEILLTRYNKYNKRFKNSFGSFWYKRYFIVYIQSLEQVCISYRGLYMNFIIALYLFTIFMPPLKKGAYCFATVSRSVGMSVGRYVCLSVCRPSLVRSISFDPFT